VAVTLGAPVLARSVTRGVTSGTNTSKRPPVVLWNFIWPVSRSVPRRGRDVDHPLGPPRDYPPRLSRHINPLFNELDGAL